MITEEKAYDILALDNNATPEEIIARYQTLKDQYRKIKDETADLKTQLAYQLKQIELDDVFIYFRNVQKYNLKDMPLHCPYHGDVGSFIVC